MWKYGNNVLASSVKEKPKITQMEENMEMWKYENESRHRLYGLHG
jgi:hypothetical protein